MVDLSPTRYLIYRLGFRSTTHKLVDHHRGSLAFYTLNVHCIVTCGIYLYVTGYGYMRSPSVDEMVDAYMRCNKSASMRFITVSQRQSNVQIINMFLVIGCKELLTHDIHCRSFV